MARVIAAILAHREIAPLLSDDHFSVDGALAKAWASMKNFQSKAEATPPDDDGPGDLPGPDVPTRANPTQSESEADPIPRPTRKNRNAQIDFKGEKRSTAM